MRFVGREIQMLWIDKCYQPTASLEHISIAFCSHLAEIRDGENLRLVFKSKFYSSNVILIIVKLVVDQNVPHIIFDEMKSPLWSKSLKANRIINHGRCFAKKVITITLRQDYAILMMMQYWLWCNIDDDDDDDAILMMMMMMMQYWKHLDRMMQYWWSDLLIIRT